MTQTALLPALAHQAARWIRDADALLVAAGAGMGVDSGLPDFRGREGFWRAYPALGRAGLAFEEIANPAAFERDPMLAWGFYGHRLALYRRTAPHPGFGILRALGDALPGGVFVFTSNVDGHFQKAGFDHQSVVEIHGSIHHLQCLQDCRRAIWSADGFEPEVDREACRLLNAAPRCPHCGGIARPNILMFDDWHWLGSRTADQLARFEAWRLDRGCRPLTIELGAGRHVITVRQFAERSGGRMIRINPEAEAAPGPDVLHLRCGALEGLTAIREALVGEASSTPDGPAPLPHPPPR